jgi:RNA polymerase sporulation-specific sigma factor
MGGSSSFSHSVSMVDGSLSDSNDLVGQLQDIIKAMARRLARGNGSYEDLLQEGNQAVFAAIHKFRNDRGASFGTFAVTCARNKMLDCLKKEARICDRILSGDMEISSETHETLFDRIATSEPSPYDLVSKADLVRQTQAAVQALPERERSCVEKFFQHQISCSTIAKEMGISRPRVAQLINQGISRLREQLLAPRSHYATL